MSHLRIALAALAVFVISFSFIRAEDAPASQPAVKPVDFHKLQDLMPDTAAGVNRANLGGENMTVGEMATSNATADYTKPDSDGSDAHTNITITDYGANTQMLAGMTA